MTNKHIEQIQQLVGCINELIEASHDNKTPTVGFPITPEEQEKKDRILISKEVLESRAILSIPAIKDATRKLELFDEMVEALRLADCALSGSNMNMDVVCKKIKQALNKARGE